MTAQQRKDAESSGCGPELWLIVVNTIIFMSNKLTLIVEMHINTKGKGRMMTLPFNLAELVAVQGSGGEKTGYMIYS